MQKSPSVLQEDSLQAKLIAVDVPNAGNDYGQQECNNSHHYLQTTVVVKET
jgi:hypothetical protein